MYDYKRTICFILGCFFTCLLMMNGCGNKNTQSVSIEFRLAETEPADGLVEMTVRGTSKRFYVHDDVLLSNTDIDSAFVVMWQNRPVVELVCTKSGGEKLATLTEENIGKHIGMLVDGILVSAPRVNDTIPNGHAIIIGDFSLEEAQRIADGVTQKLSTRKGTKPFGMKAAEQLLQLYMQALRGGDKGEIYRFWCTQSLAREGFDYMHLWIGDCIPISQWKNFFQQHDCSYKITNVRSVEDYYIIDFDWNVLETTDIIMNPEVHQMRYYVIRENEKWALINPIDILTRDWLQYETEHFHFHYPPHIHIDDFIPELKFMDQGCKDIVKYLDIEIEDKIHYYKARTPQECGDLVCFPPANGYCARGLPFRSDSPRWFHVVISTSFINLHEVVHLLAPTAALYSINDAFDEGIAVSLGGTTFHTPEVSSAQTRYLLDRKEYVPLETLLTNKEVFWRYSHVTYQQAGSFIRFLLHQYGLEPLRKLCNEPEVSNDLTNSIHKIYELTISELEEKWHEYLLRTDYPEIKHSIPKEAEVVFSMNDPQGDDDGDGNYSYPEDDRYEKGAFDLRAFEILKDEKNVYFRLKLENITGVVSYDYIEEQFAPGAVIAISKSVDDEKYCQKYFDGIQLENNNGYHLKLCVGFGLAILNNYGKIFYSKKDAFNNIAKVAKNVFEFSLPIDFIGEPDTDWEYFVGVGLMGDRTMHFSGGPMPVHKKHRFFISGGNFDFGNPAFIDILLPENMNQTQILGNYDAVKGKPATIPMLKHN